MVYIIDFIVNIYRQDTTEIFMNNEKQTDIDISSGIRQGCNCSSTLFILITYYIIHELYKRLKGFNNNIIKIVSFFYADDGLILADNEEETRKSTQSIRSIASDMGLKINTEKSNILIYNNKSNQQDNYTIEDINIKEEIKYLGTTITNKRDCFKKQKTDILKSAKKYMAIIPSVTARGCNRIILGKTF